MHIPVACNRFILLNQHKSGFEAWKKHIFLSPSIGVQPEELWIMINHLDRGMQGAGSDRMWKWNMWWFWRSKRTVDLVVNATRTGIQICDFVCIYIYIYIYTMCIHVWIFLHIYIIYLYIYIYVCSGMVWCYGMFWYGLVWYGNVM